METVGGRGSRWPLYLELLAAAALGAWRLAAAPPREWWRDWGLLVAVYWALSRILAKPSTSDVVTAGVIAYLLGIYLFGALPHALAVLGLAR